MSWRFLSEYPTASRGHLVGIWSVVFGINLIVPVIMAHEVAPDSWPGVFAAVACWWLAGAVLCWNRARLGRVMAVGAAWTGLTSILPFLQFFTGIVALQLWVTATGDRGRLNDRAAFIVTHMTAAQIALVAFVFGGGWRLFRRPPTTSESLDYGESATEGHAVREANK